MYFKKNILLLLIVALICELKLSAHQKHYYQTDFPIAEFDARRAQIFDTIGENATAIIQSGCWTGKSSSFRTGNDFHH